MIVKDRDALIERVGGAKKMIFNVRYYVTQKLTHLIKQISSQPSEP